MKDRLLTIVNLLLVVGILAGGWYLLNAEYRTPQELDEIRSFLKPQTQQKTNVKATPSPTAAPTVNLSKIFRPIYTPTPSPVPTPEPTPEPPSLVSALRVWRIEKLGSTVQIHDGTASVSMKIGDKHPAKDERGNDLMVELTAVDFASKTVTFSAAGQQEQIKFGTR